MIRRARAALLGLAACAVAAAQAAALGVDPPLADPRLETRAIALHKQLRCLVCQNQSIHDSNADLATDLRRLVRERLLAGDSDREAITHIVGRYGDWVLLDPPFKLATAALWGGPAALILIAAAAVAVSFRRRGRPSAAAPLSPAERARLDRLLEGDREADP